MTCKIDKIEQTDLRGMKITTQSLKDSILTYDDTKNSRLVLVNMLHVGIECINELERVYDYNCVGEIVKTRIRSMAMFIIDHFDSCTFSLLLSSELHLFQISSLKNILFYPSVHWR